MNPEFIRAAFDLNQSGPYGLADIQLVRFVCGFESIAEFSTPKT